MKKVFSTVFLLVFLIVGGARCLSASSSFAASAATPMPTFVAGGAARTEAISPEFPGMSAKSAPEFVADSERADFLTLASAKEMKAGEEVPEVADPAESLKDPETGEESDTGDSDNLESDYVPEEGEAPSPTIADPLEPFNRAMYHFNDKLYFWLLKPVSQAYGKVVPEPARISVRNFFTNLAFPIRFLSCLLQADFSGAAKETGRFTVNTVWGIGGLLDPSSAEELNIPKQNVDLGQTLGLYGAGPGFYLVWPVFGSSSLRDSVNIVGGFFLSPVNYLNPWYTPVAVRSYEEVNRTSLSIGDYESLKGAAIDPYFSIRDAFVQHRINMINARKDKAEQPQSADLPQQQEPERIE